MPPDKTLPKFLIITLRLREVTYFSQAKIFENLFLRNRKGEKTMVLFIKLFNKFRVKS